MSAELPLPPPDVATRNDLLPAPVPEVPRSEAVRYTRVGRGVLRVLDSDGVHVQYVPFNPYAEGPPPLRVDNSGNGLPDLPSTNGSHGDAIIGV